MRDSSKLSDRAYSAMRIHAHLSGGPAEASAAVTDATLALRDAIAAGASLADLAIALGGIARIQSDLEHHEEEESLVTFNSFIEVGFRMFEGVTETLKAKAKKEEPKETKQDEARNLNSKLN